jgi:methylation protein EvaC
MPIANKFALPDEPIDDFRYTLAIARCNACHMVQLTDVVPRERMFNAQYPFYSSTSQHMVAHFSELASWLENKLNRQNIFVVELGSNDGTLLDYFARREIRHLGVEPAANVAKAAAARGVRTRTTFFDKEEAAHIRSEDGLADAIIGCNVLCHVPYLDSVMRGILALLKQDGLFVFEDPYLPEILKRVAFDQFYDEHAWYFTVTSVERLAHRYGLTLLDTIPQPTHGGSMRYVLARSGTTTQRVVGLLAAESKLGLDTDTPYDAFAERVKHNCDELVVLLESLRREGRRIMGYGATAKSATVINYCRISEHHVEAICDTTPIKQGTLSPGARIPVVPRELFVAHPPDYALLFAWNHAAEIWKKEESFRANGGHWITYVPRVEVC